ncbi:MAG: hypothetical protein GF355_13055 [Candidatus Eisenbacteria bacterium]|nr:hypothetical protein [Candidatus Eisenbacteria bacterium]
MRRWSPAKPPHWDPGAAPAPKEPPLEARAAQSNLPPERRIGRVPSCFRRGVPTGRIRSMTMSSTLTANSRTPTPGRFNNLAKLGFSVIPTRHPDHDAGTPEGKRGKKPVGKWERFQKERPTPEEIESWERANQGFNVAVVTGEISRVVVLDVDSEDALRQLEERETTLPRTPTVKTGRGYHYYFKHPGASVGNGVAIGEISGLDMRGDGGYVIGPGSVHENGHRYEWEVRPDEADFAPLPDWLMTLLKKNAGQEESGPGGNGKRPPTRRDPEVDRYAQVALEGEAEKVRSAIRPAGPGQPGNRNDTLNRAAFSLGQLVGAGRLDKVTVETELFSAATSNGLTADDGEHAVRATIQSGLDAGMAQPRQTEDRASSASSESPDENGPERPTIVLRGGDLPAILDQAERALLSAGKTPLYQRGELLVRVIRTEDLSTADGMSRRPGTLQIRPILVPYLVEQFTRVAEWLAPKGRSDDKELKPVDCPKRYAETYLARVGDWRLPPLRGIIEAPTLLQDGSILASPGYDKRSGLLYVPGRTQFAPIPDRPTLEDARVALQTLREVLDEFPFLDESDAAVALSAILTSLIRRSLRVAPMHAFRAPKPRSGKTALADSVAMLATGRPCAVMSQAAKPEDESKRLLAVLLQGDPVICHDNIDRPFGSAAICQALTQETITDRLLGQTRMVTVPTTATFLATGNNLTFVGDITARVLACDIDPQLEHPEERSFRRDLYAYIPKHRGRLVAAALTLLRAYHVAGRPDQRLPRWGGFDEWSNWVRSGLVWAGMPDPCATRARIEDQDPVRRSLSALLAAWHEVLGERALTAAELVKEAGLDEKESGLEPSKTALCDALKELAEGRTGISTRVLGNYLQKHANRIEGGLKVEPVAKKSRATIWRVVAVPRGGGV